MNGAAAISFVHITEYRSNPYHYIFQGIFLYFDIRDCDIDIRDWKILSRFHLY